jgi:DNA-binding TFAR19-related protein (PDSD5 family)
MAQTGQLRGRVNEEQLIELLEQARVFARDEQRNIHQFPGRRGTIKE